MEVFGEEYDLSKCTEAEKQQVEKWHEDNKAADVPVDPDYVSGKFDCEGSRGVMQKPSDELNIALALEALNRPGMFAPDMNGKSSSIELYILVHPLGGNMSVEDAAERMGINKVTAYRRLARLAELSPEVYDLHRWPTKAQLDVYRLIHPDLGGLTYTEAAKALGSTYQHVVQMMCRMRKTHPTAFAFERIAHRPKVVSFNPVLHDDKVVEKF